MDIPQGLVVGTQFESRFVQARQVDIWLPPEYTAGGGRFPVLYMHDGQNVFVPEWSYRGVDWGVDEAVIRLSADGAIPRPPIVVGIWNTSLRINEYLPCRPLGEDFSGQETPMAVGPAKRGCGSPEVLAQFARRLRGPILSDAYLRFIVEELKPWVDQTYRTLPEREHTRIMGSSMGGLISLYALCEYPEVFGGAGCVSTHWPLGGNRYLPYLRARLPLPGVQRIYFDHGSEDLDRLYAGYQRRVDKLMLELGYRDGLDWMTRVFPGAGHSEMAWRARLDTPLRFLFT